MRAIEGDVNNISVSLPVYARQVAWHALELAKESEKGRTFHLITVRVFTAFMLEGGIECLGQALFGDEWEKETTKGNYKCLKDKNTMIRQKIGYGSEKQSPPIKELVKFRNSFAHPKILKFENTSSWDNLSLTPSEWEESLTLALVEKEFEGVCKYCEALFNATADFWERDYLTIEEKINNEGVASISKTEYRAYACRDIQSEVNTFRLFWGVTAACNLPTIPSTKNYSNLT